MLKLHVGYIINADAPPEAERGAKMITDTIDAFNDWMHRETGGRFDYEFKMMRVPETMRDLQLNDVGVWNNGLPVGQGCTDLSGEGMERSRAWEVFQREFWPCPSPRNTRRFVFVWSGGGYAGAYHVQPIPVQDGTTEDIGEGCMGGWDLTYFVLGTNTPATPGWATKGRNIQLMSEGKSWSASHELGHVMDLNMHYETRQGDGVKTMNQIGGIWQNRQMMETNREYPLDSGVAFTTTNGIYVTQTNDTINGILAEQGLSVDPFFEVNGQTFGAIVVRLGSAVNVPYDIGLGERVPDRDRLNYRKSNLQFVYEAAVPAPIPAPIPEPTPTPVPEPIPEPTPIRPRKKKWWQRW